jgi:hypothetical protein
MDYFYAVQEGRARVQRAVDALQEVAGPSYAVLFLKQGRDDWSPVGEENLWSVVKGRNSTAVVVICDADGNAKAMSAWVAEDEAGKWAISLESRGVPRYPGEIRLPA